MRCDNADDGKTHERPKWIVDGTPVCDRCLQQQQRHGRPPAKALPYDARGVLIEVGATCVYGAPVSRSIALVDGVVDGFTPTGRVWVRIVHRAYGGWSGAERVHVGADRLVIVAELPPSPLPTEVEKNEAYRERRARTDTTPPESE